MLLEVWLLTDSVLTLIKSAVKDPLAQGLLKCLDTLKYIAQIGYIVPPDNWNKDPDYLKKAIVKATDSDDIEYDLIIDPVHNGYCGYEAWTQYFYRDDGSTDKWEEKWAQKKYHASSPWRVFLVSGNRKLMAAVQDGLQKVMENEKIKFGKIYPAPENFDLMPDIS
ncbi:PREDICTED: uncharacterized protein LOC109588520 [Amphimedon queenslandica]|uniref:Uncharacterized protein n=1 Tax=Amphimedon queenslandica TaxID=400682 RepID=A0AAN0JT65_AMPQE|nr:PREDICTED: uncharacterized protein LOC109588520 [Amphimedon queenslandica]|eukprot:XP_019860236.1 PREDICTED: uncharacterized protein LOC109588520 [Amphimedon queenslandica]